MYTSAVGNIVNKNILMIVKDTNNTICIPSEQETLNQCWVNVGPASQTLDQH